MCSGHSSLPGFQQSYTKGGDSGLSKFGSAVGFRNGDPVCQMVTAAWSLTQGLRLNDDSLVRTIRTFTRFLIFTRRYQHLE